MTRYHARGAFAVLLAIAIPGLSAGAVRPLAGQETGHVTAESRLTGSASLDLVGQYVFRGRQKDDRGAILQPALGFEYAITEKRDTGAPHVAIVADVWSSVHFDTRHHPGELGMFETDVGLALDVAFENWALTGGYVAYLAPTGAFEPVHELALSLGHEGVRIAEGLAVRSGVLLARELHEGDEPLNTYVEITAAIDLPATGAVTWGVPLALGLSPDGYFTNAEGGDETVGFGSIGVEGSAALGTRGASDATTLLVGAVGLTFVNGDAGLTRDPSQRRLWVARLGLAFHL